MATPEHEYHLWVTTLKLKKYSLFESGLKGDGGGGFYSKIKSRYVFVRYRIRVLNFKNIVNKFRLSNLQNDWNKLKSVLLEVSVDDLTAGSWWRNRTVYCVYSVFHEEKYFRNRIVTIAYWCHPYYRTPRLLQKLDSFFFYRFIILVTSDSS